MRFGLAAIGVGSVAVAAIAAACQTYDFEPVQPFAFKQEDIAKYILANPAKPNVMLVVDKSGSMLFPVDTSNSNCPSGCGPAPSAGCPASCPTRLSEMKGAMGEFLTLQGDVARFGLAVFPDGATGVCAPGITIHQIPTLNDDAIALAGAAVQINGTIQGIQDPRIGGGLPANGGTPTAPTLRTLENYTPLLDGTRKNIVLLLTDGLPNCNSTLVASSCTCVPGASCASTNLNCLDATASIEAVAALSARNILTMVVGFGADTAGAGVGFDTLNKMAEAGGLFRKCPTGTECGIGDTCTNGLCGRKFYQAGNRAELALVLENLALIIRDYDPCEYVFSAAPSDPSFVVVYVDGAKYAPGANTWSYDPASLTVRLEGDLCAKVTASKESVVEARALGTF
jgi:hypothetical protein